MNYRRAQNGVTLMLLPESTSVDSWLMINLKPASQAEATEQVKRTFLNRKTGLYFSLQLIQCPWGCSLPSIVSLIILDLWGLEIQSPVHQSQALRCFPGVDCVYYWLWWGCRSATGAGHSTTGFGKVPRMTWDWCVSTGTSRLKKVKSGPPPLVSLIR